MVPGYFVLLDRLPLGPNGKLDYDALPPVTESSSTSNAAAMAPRSRVEAKLCEIFTEVLGRERIGVEDNFFSPRRPFLARRSSRAADKKRLWRRPRFTRFSRGADGGGAGAIADTLQFER